MKTKLFILTLFCSNLFLTAQNVGINVNGATPDASAMLDIVSTSRGLLIPRVALTARNVAAPITAPVLSLLVFNTATASSGATAVVPGYYYWDGSNWVRLLNTNAIGNEWNTLGNAGTAAATNFLGTTDAVGLVFRTDNTERMRVTYKD